MDKNYVKMGQNVKVTWLVGAAYWVEGKFPVNFADFSGFSDFHFRLRIIGAGLSALWTFGAGPSGLWTFGLRGFTRPGMAT